MDEERFWDLLALARQDRAGAFHQALVDASDTELEELVALYHALKRQLMASADRAATAEPADVRRLAQLAEWIVSQGFDRFEAVLFKDEAFPSRLPDGVSPPGLDRDVQAVYKARTGRWIPRRAPAAADDVLLDQDGFWTLVELAHSDAPAFKRALEAQRPGDLIAFYWEVDALRNLLSSRELKDRLDAKVTRDWESWMSFTDWVLGLGRQRVEDILADPSQMPASLPAGAVGFPLEKEAARVFKRRFGEDIPLRGAGSSES